MNKRAINTVIILNAEDGELSIDALRRLLKTGTGFQIYESMGSAPMVIALGEEAK